MALADLLAFGNASRGAYLAQQQALINAQRQQQINNLLANDALNRQLMQAKVQGGGEGLSALAGAPPVASPVAPAPAPGQNSAQQPAPVAVPSPVPMPGAMNQTALPPLGTHANMQIPPATQSRRDQYALQLMQQEMTAQRARLAGATPAQAQAIRANMSALQQEMAALAPSAGATPATSQSSTSAPASTPKGAQAAPVQVAPKGEVGRALALVQNNMPLQLLAHQVARIKAVHPNISDTQLYYAVQAINPTLAAQANQVVRSAGLSIDALIKGIGLSLQSQGIQLRAAALPSQIAANTAKARAADALAKLYESGVFPTMGVPGQPGAQQDVPGVLSYMETGQRPPMGRYQEYGLQPALLAQAREFGLPAGAIPSVWSTYKSAQTAQNTLQRNYSQFQTSASTLHATFQRAQQLAKQLELDGIAKINQGRLAIDRSLAPAGSPQAQLVAQYDTIINEMKRDYGVVSAFGKMTGYGFKSASDVFDPNRGVALEGVNAAIQFGTTQGENAFRTTNTNLQNASQIKIIELSKNKEAAAAAMGFQLGAPGLVQQYAKKYGLTPQEARAELLAHHIYVGP